MILPIKRILFIACVLSFSPLRAQVITNVSTAAELATALNQSFLYSQGSGNLLTNRITLPEPSTYALLGLGVLLWAAVYWWRKRETARF
jgi:hypothetical protein